MKDIDKTKEKLVGELEGLRRRVSELEGSESNINKVRSALEETAQRLKAIFDNAYDSMVFLDASGRVINFNDQAAQMLGMTKEDMLGKHFMDLGVLYPEDMQDIKERFEGILRGEKHLRTSRIKNARSQDVILECSTNIVKDGEKILGAIIIARDITERKKAEDRLRAILDKSPIPTAIGGLDGSIIVFNRALENLIGYGSDEISDINDWAAKLYPDKEYRNFVWKNIEQALKGKRQDCAEFRVACKDGTAKTLDFYTSFFEDGLVIQMVDITDRKKAEEALKEKNIALKEILESLEIEKKEIQDNVMSNIDMFIMPILKKMNRQGTRKQVSLLQKNLEQLTSSFGRRMAHIKLKLTLRELEVCNMIKSGLSSKEISAALNLSPQTIERHRNNIRQKLGIVSQKVNLASYLQHY
ncbi:PAS domain S-box protein [Candidatus Omnitrophota bacterium]